MNQQSEHRAQPEHDARHDPAPDLDGEPGSDLDPDESADVMETSQEAHRIKKTRDDQREDGGIISLDPGD